MSEDLSPFFAGLDAVPVVIHNSLGDRTITGYFDNSFFNSQIGETILESTQPRVTCKTSDVEGVPRESTLTIEGVLYSIIEPQPEGTGMTILRLAIEPNTLDGNAAEDMTDQEEAEILLAESIS